MKSALKTELIILSRRWPELLFLVFLSVCVGLYRTLGPGEMTVIHILTNQRFALLPGWALAEVVFRSRQGELTYRASILSGHTRGGAFRAKLAACLLLALLLDALGCVVGLLSRACFSSAILPLLLLRLWLDLGYAAALLLTVQLPMKTAPTRFILSGGIALALGMVGGMDALPLALSLMLLLACPALAWTVIRRCEL